MSEPSHQTVFSGVDFVDHPQVRGPGQRSGQAVEGFACGEDHGDLGPYRRVPEVATVLLDVDESRERASRPRPTVEGERHEC